MGRPHQHVPAMMFNVYAPFDVYWMFMIGQTGGARLYLGDGLVSYRNFKIKIVKDTLHNYIYIIIYTRRALPRPQQRNAKDTIVQLDLFGLLGHVLRIYQNHVITYNLLGSPNHKVLKCLNALSSKLSWRLPNIAFFR